MTIAEAFAEGLDGIVAAVDKQKMDQPVNPIALAKVFFLIFW